MLPKPVSGFGCNGNRNFPVSSALDQVTHPTAEPFLLIAHTHHDCPSTHQQQASEVGIPRLGNPAWPRFAAITVLPRHHPHPCRQLSAVIKGMPIAQTRHLSTGGGVHNPWNLHQTQAAIILLCCTLNQRIIAAIRSANASACASNFRTQRLARSGSVSRCKSISIPSAAAQHQTRQSVQKSY